MTPPHPSTDQTPSDRVTPIPRAPTASTIVTVSSATSGRRSVERPRARAAAATARWVRLLEEGTRIEASIGPERRIRIEAGSGEGMDLFYTPRMRDPGGGPRAWILTVPLAVLAGGAPPPPTPMIETVDVSLVLVPVVVRDAAGHPVTDLAQGDFTIREEGAPQAITAFGKESRPVSIVLALDTSPSMRGNDLGMKRAAIDFIRAQRPGVDFAVESFNDGVTQDAGFTADRSAIELAVGALRLGGDNTALFDAIEASCRTLESREGGHIAVLFTDGAETLHPQDELEKRLGDLVEEATRHDVSVYTVAFGPRAAVSVLRRISDETGGEAFSAVTAPDLSAAFANVAESVGNRYLLGYRAPEGRPGFRRIEVTIARPGLRIASRKGYYTR
jgi:Ca-activated chloride channel homolog